MSGKDIDDVTGIETTGHVWDGDLKELNKPLPKWWLWTFYVTIVWAIGYWVLYPAWPTLDGYTKGVAGYSQRATVAAEIEAGKAAQGQFRTALADTDLADVGKDQKLLQFAIRGGKAAFADNCAPCHGRGAQGGVGYPNLNDDDWIWGGKLEEIQQTILYGIRSGHPDGRESEMPKFGVDEILTKDQIDQVAAYVLSLSGKSEDAAAVEAGKALYADNCVACHGEEGKGNPELGAPNLTDALWLFGDSKAAVTQSIATGRGGKMPPWVDRLDPVTIKALSIYVHSLGGVQ